MSSEETVLAELIERHRARPGALLPLLHDVNDRLGHIPATAVAPIARALNLSRAEVHGVITFYHHFRRAPGGRHTVRLCQAEACQSRGAEALALHAQGALGCGWHETSTDGAVTLEPVYCLGQCACSPALMIDDDVHARVTPARFDRLLAQLRAEGGSEKRREHAEIASDHRASTDTYSEERRQQDGQRSSFTELPKDGA